MSFIDSALYIALLAVLMTASSFYVTLLRGKTGILHGDGGNETLGRARRAHYQVLEFGVPFAVLLIAYDITGGSGQWIMWLGIVFLATRLFHMVYMYRFSGLHLFRGIGTIGSHGVNVILIVLILMSAAG